MQNINKFVFDAMRLTTILTVLFSIYASACQEECMQIVTSSKKAVLTDLDGHPLSNARIVVRDGSANADGPKAYCGRFGPVVMRLQTDSKGKVDISKLKPGEYWLTYMDDQSGESFYIQVDPSAKSRKALVLSLDHLGGRCHLVDVERNVTKPPSDSRPVNDEGHTSELHASFTEAKMSIEPPELDEGGCATESVGPNLFIAADTRVLGKIEDQSGAMARRSKVSVLRYESPTYVAELKSVITDDAGTFDLGTLYKGSYRILASPNRGFAQPDKLDCYGQAECKLDIVLKTNPTDLPYAACPIK